MSTLLRRRGMLAQKEELLPYIPLDKITWTYQSGGFVTQNFPVRNGASIHDGKGWTQIRDENGVRVQGYTKDYTALPEVVGNYFSIWRLTTTKELADFEADLVANNFSITYL